MNNGHPSGHAIYFHHYSISFQKTAADLRKDTEAAPMQVSMLEDPPLGWKGSLDWWVLDPVMEWDMESFYIQSKWGVLMNQESTENTSAIMG